MANVKLIALLPLAGKFLLPYDEGMEFEIEEKQAAVIVNAKYAAYVTAGAVKASKGGNSVKAEKEIKQIGAIPAEAVDVTDPAIETGLPLEENTDDNK